MKAGKILSAMLVAMAAMTRDAARFVERCKLTQFTRRGHGKHRASRRNRGRPLGCKPSGGSRRAAQACRAHIMRLGGFEHLDWIMRSAWWQKAHGN